MPKHLPREYNARRRRCPLSGYGAHGDPGFLEWVTVITDDVTFDIPKICLEHIEVSLHGRYVHRDLLEKALNHRHSERRKYGPPKE